MIKYLELWILLTKYIYCICKLNFVKTTSLILYIDLYFNSIIVCYSRMDCILLTIEFYKTWLFFLFYNI